MVKAWPMAEESLDRMWYSVSLACIRDPSPQFLATPHGTHLHFSYLCYDQGSLLQKRYFNTQLYVTNASPKLLQLRFLKRCLSRNSQISTKQMYVSITCRQRAPRSGNSPRLGVAGNKHPSSGGVRLISRTTHTGQVLGHPGRIRRPIVYPT